MAWSDVSYVFREDKAEKSSNLEGRIRKGAAQNKINDGLKVKYDMFVSWIVRCAERYSGSWMN